MIKNEPRLKPSKPAGLHPVEHAESGSAIDETDTLPPGESDLPGARRGLRVIADLETELRRNGLEPDLIDPNVVLPPKSLFVFPRVHPDDDEHRYMRRVRTRSALATLWLSSVVVFLVLAIASMFFTTSELYVKPREQELHRQYIESGYRELIANTDLAIDPLEPRLPDWLWSSFSPDWYIEEAVYANNLDLSDQDIELLSFLREKKAIIAREIEPAYSNDKLQNRLRDPSIIYFGSDYDRAYQRFVNMVLAITAIAREENATPGLDTIFTTRKRAELVRKITLPKPPEPNAYYDSRIEGMISDLSRDGALIGGPDALVAEDAAEHQKLIGMLDSINDEIGEQAFTELTQGGLGPVLRLLPYGWSSTDLTRAFYDDRRRRFIDWNVFELRLLMLDLIYGAAELPQELPLVHLYLHHLGGEGFQSRYAEIATQNIIAEATTWVESDVQQEGNPSTREQRFIKAFMDNGGLELQDTEEPNARRVALSLLFKAARFEHAYSVVESAEGDLVARPFLGRMGLPVRNLEPANIKPWGLYNARRNGYAHEGLDIGAELGAPALAVMDGTIVRGGYQRAGAGNYLVLAQDNMEVTYMHLLREPSPSNYKRLLTREELNSVGNDAQRGYDIALRRYASKILNKSMDSLSDDELDLNYLREKSTFDQILASIRSGNAPRVRRGDSIANVGLSGNVTLNSARPEMIYPHIHLEINGGRIDPMQVIEEIGSRWYEIRDHHLNHPFYRNWLKQEHNWSWYSKFYPSGAIPDDVGGS